MAARVFFSCSHAEEEQRNQLEKNLAILKRQGLVESWHDSRILAGEVIDNTMTPSWNMPTSSFFL